MYNASACRGKFRPKKSAKILKWR